MKQFGKGGCLCGEVTWAYEGSHEWSCYCHCKSCRANTASPVTAFFGVRTDRFRWTGKRPAVYRSSEGVRRSFCATCGTPMAFEADRYPGEIHLYAVAHEDHARVAPRLHVHTDEQLDWFEISDEMPRHGGFANGD
ncbi:MAG: GFA family protein [Paracoccaceae bacterium]